MYPEWSVGGFGVELSIALENWLNDMSRWVMLLELVWMMRHVLETFASIILSSALCPRTL